MNGIEAKQRGNELRGSSAEKLRCYSAESPRFSAQTQRSSASIASIKGFTLTELMITIAIVGVVMAVGPNLLLNMVKFFRLQIARAEVQRDARAALDLINRNLRQATSTTVAVKNRPNQPPYSWLTFEISKGTGAALGWYGFYQEGSKLQFNNRGSTTTISENLRYLAFTYPRSDNAGIVSISMTFEKATYAGYTKALQLSIEKVRIMN